MNLPARITIREVGARDGLQSEAPLDVDDRLELLDALLIAGVTHLEVAAFVSPAAVPAMAGAADVVAGLGAPEGVVRAALVPNVRGAELALAAGIDELTVTISASATYNQRNVRMSIDESLAAIAAICVLAGPVPVDAVISCAFGSPYEGDSLPADVALLAERLRASGASAVTLADTTGTASTRAARWPHPPEHQGASALRCTGGSARRGSRWPRPRRAAAMSARATTPSRGRRRHSCGPRDRRVRAVPWGSRARPARRSTPWAWAARPPA